MNIAIIEEMCKTFFTEQIKLINQYMQKIEEVMKDRDQAYREAMLMKEKVLLMNQIHDEHEKIKDSIGI